MREGRRPVLHSGEQRGKRDERIGVAWLRMADAGGPARGRVHLPDGVDLLLPEREPKPGIHETCVGRRHHREVARAAGVEPALGDGGVEVADVLGVGGGVAGVLDPGVRTPHGVVARRPDKVRHDAAVAQRDDAIRTLGAPQLLDLGASGVRLLKGRRQKRLGHTVAAVPLGEEHRRGGQVLLSEGEDLERHSASMPFQAGT